MFYYYYCFVPIPYWLNLESVNSDWAGRIICDPVNTLFRAKTPNTHARTLTHTYTHKRINARTRARTHTHTRDDAEFQRTLLTVKLLLRLWLAGEWFQPLAVSDAVLFTHRRLVLCGIFFGALFEQFAEVAVVEGLSLSIQLASVRVLGLRCLLFNLFERTIPLGSGGWVGEKGVVTACAPRNTRVGEHHETPHGAQRSASPRRAQPPDEPAPRRLLRAPCSRRRPPRPPLQISPRRSRATKAAPCEARSCATRQAKAHPACTQAVLRVRRKTARVLPRTAHAPDAGLRTCAGVGVHPLADWKHNAAVSTRLRSLPKATKSSMEDGTPVTAGP